MLSRPSARSLGDWLRRCGGASPVTLRTGTGARKKGASPHKNVDRLSGEPACTQGIRVQACRRGESTITAEAFMNIVG